jgi:hypothetical protein
MENVKKFLPLILGGIVAIIAFIISKKIKNKSENNTDRSQILEKAREAKLAKSILKNSENDSQSPTD